MQAKNGSLGQVALGLANARMIDQIRCLAFYDSLTGLLPIGSPFKTAIWSRNPEREPAGLDLMLAVCFLDLDHFPAGSIRHRWATGSATGRCRRCGRRVRDCAARAPNRAVGRRASGAAMSLTVIAPRLICAIPRPRLPGLARTLLNSLSYAVLRWTGTEVFVLGERRHRDLSRQDWSDRSGKPAQERGHGDVSGQEERPEQGGVLPATPMGTSAGHAALPFEICSSAGAIERRPVRHLVPAHPSTRTPAAYRAARRRLRRWEDPALAQ